MPVANRASVGPAPLRPAAVRQPGDSGYSSDAALISQCKRALTISRELLEIVEANPWIRRSTAAGALPRRPEKHSA